MGTSLLGLKPKNTYQSLLKTSDNTAISATNKFISDGLGNDSALSLGTTNVGIGTSLPAAKLDIVSDGGGQCIFTRYGGQPQIQIRRSQGTFAAPTAVTSGASSLLAFANYDGTSFGTSATIQSVPEAQTPTARGASLALNVVTAGTTSLINGIIINSAATTPASVSISTSFNSPNSRLTIWGTALASTLPYFDIVNSGGGQLLKFSNAGNLLVGSTTPSDTAKLSVKGSGTTSATTSLLVQNSSGTAALTITDDLTATFGGTIGSGGSANFVIAAGNAAVNITSANPQNSSGSLITTGDITRTDSGTKNIINVNNGVSSTAASFGTLNGYAFTSTINQTLGTIRGLYIAPTITASTDFRAIETSVGNVLLGTTSGNFSIGTTATTARTTIKGSGSTSATTSLLVQNSAGNNNYQITDDGTHYFSANGALRLTVANSAITTNSNLIAGQAISFLVPNRFDIDYDATNNIGRLRANNAGMTNGLTMTSLGSIRVGIGQGIVAADNSSVLELQSTTMGFLPPRMTTAQKNAIGTPAAGLMVYDTTLNKLCVRTVATWETITSV